MSLPSIRRMQWPHPQPRWIRPSFVVGRAGDHLSLQLISAQDYPALRSAVGAEARRNAITILSNQQVWTLAHCLGSH